VNFWPHLWSNYNKRKMHTEKIQNIKKKIYFCFFSDFINSFVYKIPENPSDTKTQTMEFLTLKFWNAFHLLLSQQY